MAGLMGCGPDKTQQPVGLVSPEGANRIEIYLDANGRPGYRVLHGEAVVIDSSGLGFEFQGQPALMGGMELVSQRGSAGDETWEIRFQPLSTNP